MGYVTISLAFFLVFALTRGPESRAGDAIYKAELPASWASLVRFVYFLLICHIIVVNGVLNGSIPGFQLLYALFVALIIEAYELFKHMKQARATKRTKCAELAAHEGEIRIFSPAELDECEEQRLARIVSSGQLDDILTVCAEVMEPEKKSKSFRIPRWLTNDEYKALRSVMKQRGWNVDYTSFCEYTNRPELRMSPLKPLKEKPDSERK